jgi:hypothetical protein
MPMIGPAMSLFIEASMASKGNAGVNLSVMSLALGSGSVMSVVGKTFETTDTGTGSGAGVGAGVGITGVTAPDVSLALKAAYLQEFGMMGTTFPDIADAVSQGLEQQLSLATLTSAHSPVYAGTGVLNLGSIPVSASEWASNVQNLAPVLVGHDWPRFCSVIGKGCTQPFSKATGMVVIAGAGPPPPVPFSGPNSVTPAGVIS